ncbi:MAG: TIGR04438 family Trp-rich protein [Pseudomonadota bacterium]|nr:TIGR04438 family Trp-rich protein [Pseudomonadota bacterium]
MWLILVGVVLIVMNLAGIGPVAAWNWQLSGDLWKFALPFILAAVWWAWADFSGINKRREMERMEVKKRNRRNENLANLGMDPKARRKTRQR